MRSATDRRGLPSPPSLSLSCRSADYAIALDLFSFGLQTNASMSVEMAQLEIKKADLESSIVDSQWRWPQTGAAGGCGEEREGSFNQLL